jgi:cell division protease FtsH
VAYFSDHADPIHKVSIIPRGYGALGFTMQLPSEDRYLLTKDELLSKITVYLGGRCSEEIVFSEISTGARNDLEESTELARNMVCAYGMSSELGPLTYGRRQHAVFLGRDLVDESRNFSETTAQLIDREIREQVMSCKERASSILKSHLEKLHLLAQALIEKEVMELDDVKAILDDPQEPPKIPTPPRLPEESS